MAHLQILFSLVALAALQGNQAVQFAVTNKVASTTGGVRFTNEIGLEYSKQTLKSATVFIWTLFQQKTPRDIKGVKLISLFIESIEGISYTSNNEIRVSTDYIASYKGDVKKEITGVLFHEMTHVWQWDGNGQTPWGLIEGIADFVRLKAGYAPAHWGKAGEGDRWDQGYDVTAWFLNYCESLRCGFVAELNRKMRTGYSPNYFVELIGKTVDQLWSDYKAKYKN